MRWILFVGSLLWIGQLFPQEFSLRGFKEIGDHVFLNKVAKGKGPKASRGDYVVLRTVFLTGRDSLVFDSNIFNEGPVEYRIDLEDETPLITGLMHLREGDSAVIAFPAWKLYEDIKPDFYREDLWMKYRVRVFSVRDSAAHMAHKQKARRRQMHKEADTVVSWLFNNDMRAPFKTPAGTYIHWHKRGQSITPDKGDYVSLHYRGYLMNGTVFDNSWQRNEPLSYEVGKMEVIKGWKDAIGYLQEGDSVTVAIPSPLGYGEQGAGGQIPPNSILLFDIKLLQASNAEYQYNKDTTAIARYLRQHGIRAAKYPNGVAVAIEDSGKGEAIEAGRVVTLRYRARLLEGLIVEDRWEEPLMFKTNTGAIPNGLSFGLKQLKVGARAQVFVPSRLAYGPKGNEKVPSDAVLIYRVRIVEQE